MLWSVCCRFFLFFGILVIVFIVIGSEKLCSVCSRCF